MLRVLVVDDQPDFCRLAEAILSTNSHIKVVGAEGSAEAALEVIPRLKPDALLMDIQMSGMGGIEGCKAVRARYPQVQVVLTSIYGELEYGRQARDAGAVDFIPKEELTPERFRRFLRQPQQ